MVNNGSVGMDCNRWLLGFLLVIVFHCEGLLCIYLCKIRIGYSIIHDVFFFYWKNSGLNLSHFIVYLNYGTESFLLGMLIVA